VTNVVKVVCIVNDDVVEADETCVLVTVLDDEIKALEVVWTLEVG